MAELAVAGMAGLHLYILFLEMFLWTGPRARRAFGLTSDFARATKAMAANQGLYNGFLAAGLIWGLVLGPAAGHGVEIFFLCCIIVAGVYGAATVTRKILFIQAVPAAIALLLVLGSAR